LSKPQGLVRLEGLGKLKHSFTLSGFEYFVNFQSAIKTTTSKCFTFNSINSLPSHGLGTNYKLFYGSHVNNITLHTYLRKPVAKEKELKMAASIGTPSNIPHHVTSSFRNDTIKAAREFSSPGIVQVQGAERLYAAECQYLHDTQASHFQSCNLHLVKTACVGL
jgi:hypothetical protein